MRQEKGPGVGLSPEEMVVSWLEAEEEGEAVEEAEGLPRSPGTVTDARWGWQSESRDAMPQLG